MEDVGKETKVLMEGYQQVLVETKEETKEAKKDLEETKKQIETAEDELVNTKTEILKSYGEISLDLGNLKKETSGIYTQFVTILGVFAAIIFGAFGGVEILGNVLGNIQDVSTDRKSTRLNSSHVAISYAVFCLKK